MKAKKVRDPDPPALADTQVQRVAQLFRVLGEPSRLQILQLLHDGPLPVGDIVGRLDLKQANVSKQLGILHQAGLVERQRDGLQVLYRISEPLIFDLCRLVCNKLHRDAAATLATFATTSLTPRAAQR